MLAIMIFSRQLSGRRHPGRVGVHGGQEVGSHRHQDGHLLLFTGKHGCQGCSSFLMNPFSHSLGLSKLDRFIKCDSLIKKGLAYFVDGQNKAPGGDRSIRFERLFPNTVFSGS